MIVLTDEKIKEIRNRAKLNSNQQVDLISFARDIERELLSSSTLKQSCAECGDGSDDEGLALYCVKCMFSVVESPPSIQQEYKKIGYAYQSEIEEAEKTEASCLVGNKDEFGRNLPIYRRIGDIHIGGDILPGFNSEKWCKDCGAPVENVHLRNCPMLKSKL